jgi:cell division protein FtsB
VASALAVFGIALALMPIGLEAIGYQVSHRQGYAILALTALLIAAGIVVFFWPWIRGAWSWLRRDAQRDQLAARARTLELERDELKQRNEELIAESENRSDSIPDTLAEWEEIAPPVPVRNRTFRNDRVELDGFYFDNCVFDSCTFSFKGTKPFTVAASCRIEGGYNIDATRSPQALAILVFSKSLGAFHPDFEFVDPHDGRSVD